jgi:hypothetical protein
MTLARRHPFGLARVCCAEGHHAGSCRALFAALPGLSRRFDHDMIRAVLAGTGAPGHTAFAAIRTAEPIALVPREGDLARLLDDAVAHILQTAPRPLAVALSGGLDSALVLALARRHEPAIRAVVLDPKLEHYSEVEQARATAAALGVDAEVVEVSAGDLFRAIPDAIAAFEQPLYNLHPVAKLVLAREASRMGLRALVTGDGADQVMTRDVSEDYLPLVGAAFDACGVAVCTPFLADAVVAHLLAIPPDRDKRALRDVAAPLAIPRPLVDEPKRSRLVPPLPLGRLVPRWRAVELADALGFRIADRDERARVAWTTLALLARDFVVDV